MGSGGPALWMQDARYNATGAQSAYTYNRNGERTSEVNMEGVTTDCTYGDAWSNLTQMVQDPGVGHLNRATSMSYDAAGCGLTATAPDGNANSFPYNALGQPLTASFPAAAATPAESVRYTDGATGRMESVTDGRGTATLDDANGDATVSPRLRTP